MQPMGRGSYRAVIPGAEVPAEWDHMVFFELLYSDGGIRWPDWRQGPPYLVIETC
jgi:hypothetical protein